MNSPKDQTLEQLIERSRSLIRDSKQLKRLQEELIRDLKDLQQRIGADDHQD